MTDVTVVQWINSHGFICLFIYYLMSAATGSMPAPTATSSSLYVFFFKFLNTFGASIFRAFSTRIEGSPNWKPALDKANAAPPAKP